MPIRSAATRTVRSDISTKTSLSGPRHGEAVGMQEPQAVGFLQVLDKSSSQRLLSRRRQDDGGLLDRWIPGLRNVDVDPGGLERRGQSQRERKKTDIGTARLRKLSGLRDIFAQHELLP